jgi:hypothetical protein
MPYSSHQIITFALFLYLSIQILLSKGLFFLSSSGSMKISFVELLLLILVDSFTSFDQ